MEFVLLFVVAFAYAGITALALRPHLSKLQARHEDRGDVQIPASRIHFAIAVMALGITSGGVVIFLGTSGLTVAIGCALAAVSVWIGLALVVRAGYKAQQRCAKDR